MGVTRSPNTRYLVEGRFCWTGELAFVAVLWCGIGWEAALDSREEWQRAGWHGVRIFDYQTGRKLA